MQTITVETIRILKPDKTGKQRVFLFLPDNKYKKKRQIGYIKEKTFYTYRNPENIRASNSIWFNYKLISQGGSYFDLICIEYGLVYQLWTSRQKILKCGSLLHFRNNQLEKKIFLPLRYFKQSKTDADTELRFLHNNSVKRPAILQYNLTGG